MRIARMLLFIVFAGLAAAGSARELEQRTSSAAGVTVKVTPKSVAPAVAAWEFGVVLDTHSQELDDDLVKSAVLVDSQGVLRFKPLSPFPAAFELLIGRPGEAQPRVFRWALN